MLRGKACPGRHKRILKEPHPFIYEVFDRVDIVDEQTGDVLKILKYVNLIGILEGIKEVIGDEEGLVFDKKILLKFEELESLDDYVDARSIDGYSFETVDYHLKLLIEVNSNEKIKVLF